MSVVGIDLGTTNTVIACVRNGRVHVLADEQGRRLLPSVVSFHPNGDVLVGHNAKARRTVDARNTIASVKRLLGRPWSSPELEKARQRSAFEMKEGPGQGPLIVARGKEFTLPEISAFILRRAKEIAETALKEPVEKAVITVPAHFNELQRAATKVAGRVAGLEVLRILNEPTAAALAYGLGKSSKERVAVYDFGGGTFDCTLLDLNGNVFEVLATAGDPFLGGDDVDDVIAERMSDAFLLQHRFDPRADPQAFERLRQAAENLKIQLTAQEQAQVHLREVAFGVGGAHLDLTFGLTRAELEKMMEPLVAATFRVTQDALNLARLSPTEFDKTILVGGSSRIPLVRRRVEAFFGAPPMDRMNPDEVVAIGAAIQAAALTDASRKRSIPVPPGMTLPATRKSAPSFSDFSEGVPSSARAPLQSQPSFTNTDDLDTQAMRRDAVPGRHGDASGAPGSAPSTQRGVSAPPPPPAAGAPAQMGGPTGTMRLQPTPGQPRVVPRSPLPPPIPPPQPGGPLPASRPFGTIEEPSFASFPAPSFAQPPQPAEPPSPPRPPPPPPQLSPPTPSAPMTPIASPFAPLQPPPPTTRTPGPQPAPTGGGVAGAVNPYAMTAPPEQAVRYLSQPPRPPVFTQSMPPPVLIDVTPRALVVETAGGWCDTVIPRNAKIPCERTRIFSTAQDGQQTVRVRVAQGEEPTFDANTFLGEVDLAGLRVAPRGEVSVAVTFELDADGTLRVRAADSATGNQAIAELRLAGIAPEGEILAMKNRMESVGRIMSG